MITILTDIGGVILTNGWDSRSRSQAALLFELDRDEFNRRHDLYFPLLELGAISLDDYLNGTVFYKKRPFSHAEFIEFMHNQSHFLPEMKEVYLELKKKHHIQIYAVSNECAELAHWRYKQFHLHLLFDAYIVSSYIHLRKPDPAFYQMALNLSQKTGEEVIYIDDRLALVEAAQRLGISSWHHTTAISTKEMLEQLIKKCEKVNLD